MCPSPFKRSALALALADMGKIKALWGLVSLLGWQEFKHRYRRSLFGPFWITISSAAYVAAVGLVLGTALAVPLAEYVPYVSAGIVFWQFISSVVAGSCTSFVASTHLIKDLPIPVITYAIKDLYREVVALLHNIIIVPIAFICVGRWFEWTALVAVIGFLVILANLGWISLLLGIFSARYRDLQQMVSSILPILMIVTPVIWLPSMMPNRLGTSLLTFNPLAHLIDLVREPLLGRLPAAESWIVGLMAAALGWMLVICVYAYTRKRLIYWL